MKLIERNTCVLSDNSNLEFLYTFKNFPIFMGSTEKDISDDLFVDMEWVINKNNGLIQLKKLIPLNILYHKSHGAGFIGKTWNEHHKSFAFFLKDFNIKSVLEIGGSHGLLANEFHKIKNAKWTIIEPNPNPINSEKISFIKTFFDDNFKYDGEFDTIVHSHLFEHIYEPSSFIKKLSDLLDNGKYLIFSVPNMNKMLELKYTNCLNFEHTLFLTEPYIENLLSKNGFKLIKKEYYLDNHSIFYSYKKDKTTKLIELPNRLYEKNKNIFLEYIEYYKNLIFDINNKIENTDNKIYLFGAHIFSQYLISFGLNQNNIVSILDNDLTKQGNRLYGTNLIVDNPLVLKYEKEPIVILKAGIYNEEIKLDILKNINNNVIFI
jgi:2-polyprenyl-3-methyl-5-hydroxy-6-metoxy-1,4-benzoquinol methylase